MRGALFAAVAALLSSVGALAQPAVTPIQSRIEAALIDQATVVSLPVENTLDHPVRATVSLEWVDTKDSVLSSVRREISIAQGKAKLDVPFPLRFTNSSLLATRPWLRDPRRTGWFLDQRSHALAPLSCAAGHPETSRPFSRAGVGALCPRVSRSYD
jgi:hypothetical protein